MRKIAYYSDVIMGAMASRITGVSTVWSTVCSGTDQRKHQSPASLAFVRGIHRSLVDSPHKGPVTWNMFPFDDVIMVCPKGSKWIVWGSRNIVECLTKCRDYLWLLMIITRTHGNMISLRCSGLMLIHACHYNDVIMGLIASQITSLTIVYSTFI